MPVVRRGLCTACDRWTAAEMLLVGLPKGLSYRGAALGGEGARGGQAQCRERAGAGLGQHTRWLGTHLGLRRPPPQGGNFEIALCGVPGNAHVQGEAEQVS